MGGDWIMCKFCKDMKENTVNMDLVDENNNMVLLLENKQPVIGIVGADFYGDCCTWTSTKINFCPICGRDLREE